jgi:predicted DNA-binding transcriptional regulator AlpA
MRVAAMTTVSDTPAVVDLPVAAQMLGVGRTFAYQLVRDGQWPTPIIRVGRLIKVPTAPLRDLLEGRPVGTR